MSDFIASNLHKKVDHIMDVFFGAGVASHPTIIEQINYLLFMRALSQNDDDLRKLGITDKDKLVFDGELDKYRWENLLALNAEQLFIALEECYRKIPESTTNKTVRLIFRNAHIKLFDKPTLRTVLHEIDAFAKLMDEGEHAGKRDIFGDTYEYLLSKLSQAGTSGQFRTPRHIIEFLVKVIAPKKGETILDPAVGTAGFLVKAFEYLRAEYTSPEHLSSGGTFDKLNSKEHTFLYEHTFSGFDSDEDMIKFGMMNLYLHGLQNARLIRQNTLTDTAGNRDKYDILLANPPFAGKIDRDSVAEELQMNTGATEVLFLRYMIRHLTDGGRAGVIVPEGVLFNGSGAHTKIREMLLENGLWCVVSLPSGVFNPYAGVKTSIVFFDKTRKEKAKVLFAKVEHDGFSLSAQRKPINKNDLPEILNDIERFKNGEELQQLNAHAVTYDRIKDTRDYNLNGDRYKLTDINEAHDYPIVELGDLCEITSSKRVFKSEWKDEGIPFYRAREIVKLAKDGHVDNELFITEDMYEDYSKKYGSPKEGDLMVTGVGTLGICYRVTKNDKFYFKDGNIIWLKNFSNKVDSRYIKHLFDSDLVKQQIQAFSGGGTVGTYTIVRAKETKIPLPPLDLQRKIVEEIENKQKAIDHARGIISTLERERRYFDPSARAQKEDWPVVKLSDIFTLVTEKWSPGQEFTSYIGLEDIESNTGTLKTFQKETPKSTKTRFNKGDILYGRLRPNLNKAWYADISNSICSTDFVVMRPKDKNTTLSQYYLPLLQSNKINKVIVNGVSGANLPRVPSSYLLNIDVPLPPIEIQKKLADELSVEQSIIEANKKLIKIYEQKIADILSDI